MVAQAGAEAAKRGLGVPVVMVKGAQRKGVRVDMRAMLGWVVGGSRDVIGWGWEVQFMWGATVGLFGGGGSSYIGGGACLRELVCALALDDCVRSSVCTQSVCVCAVLTFCGYVFCLVVAFAFSLSPTLASTLPPLSCLRSSSLA